MLVTASTFVINEKMWIFISDCTKILLLFSIYWLVSQPLNLVTGLIQLCNCEMNRNDSSIIC